MVVEKAVNKCLHNTQGNSNNTENPIFSLGPGGHGGSGKSCEQVPAQHTGEQ